MPLVYIFIVKKIIFSLFFHTSLACRCLQKATAGAYAFFTISFYGECYGAKENLNATAIAGNRLGDCIGPTRKPCVNSEPQECVGQAFSEYIYEVQKSTYTNEEKKNNRFLGVIFLISRKFIYLLSVEQFSAYRIWFVYVCKQTFYTFARCSWSIAWDLLSINKAIVIRRDHEAFQKWCYSCWWWVLTMVRLGRV